MTNPNIPDNTLEMNFTQLERLLIRIFEDSDGNCKFDLKIDKDHLKINITPKDDEV